MTISQADFTSDYAVDGDSLYGEFTDIDDGIYGDNIDRYPEAYVGRIPCSNTNDLEIWINKLLRFEMNPGNGNPDYLKHYITTMADQLQDDYQISNNIILDNLNFYNRTIFKETPTTINPLEPHGEGIIDSINSSPCGWWTWLVHGDISDILTMTGTNNGGSPMSWINTSNQSYGLLNLNNSTKPGIVHSGSCTVAAFQSTAICMAEAYLFNPNGGGVGFSGNTDLGWIPREVDKLKALSGIINTCHNGFLLDRTHLGVSEVKSFNNPGAIDPWFHETYLIHNLFADPEMKYYTKIPPRITANHVQHTQPGAYIYIYLTNINNNDVVTVCLYKQDGLGQNVDLQLVQNIIVTPGNETAAFTLPPNLSTGKLFCTISSFNYLPYTAEILVSPGCGYVATPEEIKTTPLMPWSTIMFKDHDVIIDSNVTLTITGEIYFVPAAKLIVKPGGKLIINGGKLSTSCEALWKGVEVWGHSNLTQYSNINQGFIQVTNNGSINDAICAISTAQTTPLGFKQGTSGGMFSCTQAKFTDNLRCIHVYPYQYGNFNYNSNLSKCDFLLNDNYIPDRYPQNTAMIWYDQIKGIGNSGLTFKNIMTEVDVTHRGIGILATDAGFGLNKICDSPDNNVPCDQYRKPYFEGLYYGIKCSNTGALKNVLIGNCNFINNTRGIYLSTVTNPSVIQCTYKTIANMVNNQETNSSGIYLDGCSGYSVQENKFEGNYSTSNPITFETGIVINNSGTASNEIYNNIFTGLQYGITAQDNNLGLVCKCNDYNNVKFDQSALVSGTQGTLGIAPMQGASGSVTAPAGNTFSPQHTTQQLPESDLKNQGAGFQYYHHVLHTTYRVIPEYYSSSIGRQNTGWDYDKSTGCPSRLNGGGGGTPVESSIEKLVQQQILIDSLEIGLSGLVDGGNTEETTADIVFSNPEESLEIYYDLLSKSPYLSDTVMTVAATKEEVLSNPLLHDILVANPQSATSERVWNQLDQRVDPMPEDLFNEILEGENILAPLTAEKASITALKTDNATMYYDLMNRYICDTAQYATDSLLYLLDVQNTAEAAYLQAFLHLNNEDFSAMNSTLSGITSEFDLSNDEQILHSYYQQFFALLQQMQTDTMTDFQADSLTIDQLLELLENAPEPVKSYSRNILIANNVIVYHEPYLYDDGLKSSSVKKKHRMGPPT